MGATEKQLNKALMREIKEKQRQMKKIENDSINDRV